MLSAAQTSPAAPVQARGRRGVQAGGSAVATSISTAILFATTADDDGTPAAGLPWEGGTVLGRLVAQLETLGIRTAHVITRRGWEDLLRPSIEVPGIDVRLHPCASAAEDAAAVGNIAREAPAGLVLAYADIVTHREALAGVLADPRHPTAILATPVRRPLSFRVRLARGRVISASSPYHSVHRPTTTFLGVVKVAGPDRDALAAAADEVAGLLADPPPAWEDELDAKAERWRIMLSQPPEDVADDEPAGTPMDDPNAAPGEAAGAAEHDRPLDPAEVEAETQRRLRVVRDDVAALLLVAIVRSGTHVGTGGLRKLFWSRPLSRDAVAQAAGDITEYDEDRVLLDSAVKAKDGFFTTFFVSPYSKYIARWFAHRGWTPNGVTTLSMAIGILAAVAFATGERAGLIAGAVLLQVAFTFDCVDGQLARYSRQFSKLGAWLDSVFDRAKEYAVFAGLAIGASRVGDPVWVLAGAALALQLTRHLIDFSFAAAQHQVIAATIDAPLSQPSDIGRPPRTAAVRAAAAALAPAPEEEPPPRPPRTIRDAPRIALRLWHRIDRVPSLIWVKRMVAFPIGERFAAISIAAAVWGPRTAFVVLLVAGGIAAVYTFMGRFLRSVAS